MNASDSALFLDRDGTLIEEVGYLDRPDRVQLYPWAVDAIRALNRAHVKIVMVTNQSGVARGFFDEAMVDRIHLHIADLLRRGGAHLDAYYYCPHHPDGTVAAYRRQCDCRKPASGLVDRAVRELDLDSARSFVVGDKWLDVGLARAAGARGILVRTGTGAAEEARSLPGVSADMIVDNLAGAASWILMNLQSDMPLSDVRDPRCY